jgi:hypothetical protein
MNKKRIVPKLRSFLPMHTFLIVIGLLLVFLISACETATQEPSSEAVVYEVQTIVAETLTAQVTPSPTATPTSTPTVIPTSSLTSTTVTPTPTSYSGYWTYSTTYSCNSSEFVRDMTIPDGTILAPGEVFVKTWKFKNVGTCAWDDDYLIVFVDGYGMDGETSYLDTTVAVNKKGDASLVLTAPDDEGTYYAYWQLADEDGNTFGDMAYVEIVVSEDVTSTPTSTPIAGATPTPTYTPTATPTSTCADVATETPTSTQTPTPTYTPIPTDEPTEELTEEPTEEATEEPTEVPTEQSTEVPTVEPIETDTAS